MTPMLLAAATLVGGCKDTEGDLNVNEPETETPAPAESNAEKPGQPATAQDAASRANALWNEVGASYSSWPAATPEPTAGGEPHGAFVHTYFNATTKAAIGGEGAWPDGSVLVKNNYGPNESGDGPGQMVVVTIMSKADGTWFWAKYKADGTLMRTPEDMPIAGTQGLACIDCHQAQESRDFVITQIAAGAQP